MSLLDKIRDFYKSLFVKKEPKKPNIGEDVRLLVQSSEFENHVKSISPFLITGIIAWPSYWLYRGLEWHHIRGQEPLNVYIRKTYYRAKMLEFCILLTGILMAIRSSQRAFEGPLEVQEMVEKK
ncbi:uncharacterized protein ACRADG_001601 isoform 2-T2 [Cochliomyia hominivorax]